MKAPVMRGTIGRRILANYRVDPEVLARRLPSPFRPKTLRGHAVVGVCLIRLESMRPAGIPSPGLGSENAAHRFAVEWTDGSETREGVYIPRRDTSSRLNTLVGGRLFPAVTKHARFDVEESDGRYRIELAADDGTTRLLIDGRKADAWPEDSVFESLEESSAFFERGSCGFSPSLDGTCLDCVELVTEGWYAEPLEVEQIESSLYDDRGLFPEGSIKFDSALVMEGLRHEWRPRNGS